MLVAVLCRELIMFIMKRILRYSLSLLVFGWFALPNSSTAQIKAEFLGRFSTGIFDQAASEICAYDPATKKMFVSNGPDTSIKVVDLSNPANPSLITSISMKPYGIDLTSVACKNGVLVAAVIDSMGKLVNGKAVFFNTSTLAFLASVKVGPNPDMVTFTPDGMKVLVANEGEPLDYTVDPEGSVSIIDISNGVSSLTQSNVSTADFKAFNNQTIDPRIKITGKIVSGTTIVRNSTIAEDLEPEYITVSDDSKTAWVTCQENNAIARIDISTATVTHLFALGFKDHNIPGQGLDPTNNDNAIGIGNYPVFGMYQPDAIASYKVGDTTYLITANEGDARADWGSINNEEIRFGNSGYVLDTAKFGGATNVAALKSNNALGRLNVTKFFGDNNKDGKMDSAFCFGARSFSVWNGSTGALVWDSKDEFEQRTAAIYPSNFNATHNSNAIDSRSDDKGPEPEAATIGKILDSTYAFIGLERIGGVMIYNITNPRAPYFVDYINTRNFSVSPSAANLSTVGDLGAESIVFVPKSESPNGKDLLLVSNEVSGTVAVIQLNGRSDYQLQILHSGDMESGLSAVLDAPNYAAIADKLEDQHMNTLILSSGDNVLPGPFLSAGEDPSLQTPLRNTASLYFSGSQAVRPAIGRPDIAIMNIIGFNASAMGNHEFDLGTSDLNGQIGVDIRSSGSDKRWLGAQFPFVSANLDFTQDANLSYLFTNDILRDTAFRTPAGITSNNQKKGIAPSVIIERGGQKIGVVGATTQVLAKISSPGSTAVKGVQVDDMPALAAILQPVIDSLVSKEGVNKIILLSHLQQIANEKALAPLLRNVDIIIAGGNHAITADGNDRLRDGHTATERYPIITRAADNAPMVILNNASEWKYVGRFVCDFDTAGRLLIDRLDSNINGVYAADTAMVTSLWGTYSSAFASGTKGNGVRAICTAVGNVINSKDGNIIGKSRVFLEGRRNFVRTEETNLGNLSSDANLWYAQQIDPEVKVSIKNGGGIRSAIGFVNAVGGNVVLEGTQANPSAGKQAGDVSQLDVENSLRFNNRLVVLSVNAAGLKRIIEHGISATRPGATPGQFPQVGGVAFSYDTTKSAGNRIWSLVIIDANGNRQDTIVRNGMLTGDTGRVYKLVTLNFLANPSSSGSPVGGDGYPFPANSLGRFDLDTAVKSAGTSTFAIAGSEQDAFAEYMLSKHNTTATAYAVRDTTLQGDRRIQLLNARQDEIFPETNPALSIADARAVAAPGRVITSGIITRAWGRFIYIQDATGAIAVRQSSGDMVNAITAGNLKEGDSVLVIGPRNNFNNYAQIQLSSGSYNSSNMVVKLASGRPLPAVQELTVAQLLANAEAYESELIRIKNLRINGSGTFATSRNYEVWDGNNSGDSTILRVISAQDTEIEDAPALEIPTGKFTFEGILIQFCSSPSSGCTSGYQLQGTMKKDIQPQPELSSFALIDPANNARVVVKSGDNTPVVVRWNASATANEYTWLSALPAGDFGTPLASFPSDNAGRDTTLTLTSGAIDGLVGSLGINPGDSVTIKWTVEAVNAFETRQADAPFTLTIVRFKDLSSVSGPEFMQHVQVYPNPAENVLHISNRNGSQMKYRFADVQGRTLFTGDVMDQTTLNLEQASAGIYFLELEFEGTRSTLKIVRK